MTPEELRVKLKDAVELPLPLHWNAFLTPDRQVVAFISAAVKGEKPWKVHSVLLPIQFDGADFSWVLRAQLSIMRQSILEAERRPPSTNLALTELERVIRELKET